MKRNSTNTMKGILAAIGFVFMSIGSQAAVTIGPAGGGTCLAVTPGAFTQINWITIRENVNTDFTSPQVGVTLILTAPAGFEFNPGVGTFNVTGSDLANISMAVTNTTITFTFDVTGTGSIDLIQIKKIQVRALASNVVGDVFRTLAGGGTANITGDAPGAGISHASLTATGSGAAIASIANGNWSNAATWAGGLIPSCSDNVTISNDVVVDRTVLVNNVTISAASKLTADNDITISGNFTINATGTYTHNNSKDVSTTAFAGTESFNSSSIIEIDDWYDLTRPLAEFVTGNFGDIIFNVPGTWDNSGLFSPNVIKGDITVSDGTLVMDEGAGATTTLTLQDVLVNSDGRLIFSRGADRNLTLVTYNYTDIATASTTTKVMDNTMGNLNWTVNGDLTISRNFTVMEGAGVADVGDVVMNVTGDMSITGGNFTGVKLATASMDLTVTGNTDISGTAASVYMVRDYSGDLTFTTNDLTVSTGDKNNFMGGSGGLPTGDATYTINNDFIITGSATRVYMYLNAASTGTVNLSVARDILITDGELNIASSNADIAATISRNIDVTGSTSLFVGQRSGSSSGNTNLTVNGYVHLTDGQFAQQIGLGGAVLTVTEEINQTGGLFYVIKNSAVSNNGTVNLTMSDLVFNGGLFIAHNGYITDGRQVAVDISNNLSITFASATDQLFFIRKAGTNNSSLLLSVGGNILIGGNNSGYFQSSYSQGDETIDITGNLIVNAGIVRFNGYETGSGRDHDVTGTIQGSLFMNGGSLGLSVNAGTSNWDIQGEYLQTGGYLFHKYKNGSSTMTVSLDYSQVGGTVSLFASPTNTAANTIAIVINGDADFSSTTFNFDLSTASTAEHEIRLNGSAITIGSNAVFTHINHLSTRTVFGNINYQTAGTITYNRTTANSDIQHVNQTINAGTTLDVSGSVNDMLVASNQSSVASDYTSLDINGTLDLGTLRVYPRQQANYYSGLTVSSTGTLITGNVNGLYNSVAGNSAIYPLISGSNRMDYNLDAASTVEYNGVDNQIVTGINQGIALNTSHRYGILDINFQGTADAEWVYPYDDNIYVRNDLALTNGEFNLDIDHDATTGGRLLHIESGATISRANGYLRSETIDGSAAVEWAINTTGSNVVPFGYNSGIYIPFTFQPTAGNSGDVVMATYHSNPDNTPLPPTVTHTRDALGADNSTNTVDRYWRLEVPGAVTANLVYTFAVAEAVGIASPRAQRWEPITEGWEPPLGVQINPTATSTSASGITGLGTWWTLSSSATPLPIQLLSFDAFLQNRTVKLTWSTASELNNYFFTITRSSDGEHFTDLFNVGGAGTTTTVTNYSAVDNNPLPGVSYYRLKQTDFDGKESFSGIEKVKNLITAPITIFPNPLRNGIVTVTTGDVDDKINKIAVYDITGKMVTDISYASQSYKKASMVFELSESIPVGTYMLIVTSDSGIHRQRIIKQ
jgi:type IX secretion system substrate protein